MRSSLVLSIAATLLLGGCIAEPQVRSAAVPPATVPPAVTPPAVASSTVTAVSPPVAASAVAPQAVPAPTVAAPAASTLCGGLSSAEEARCLHVIGRDIARIGAVETGELRNVMKQVAIRQARLDDPGRPVRCNDSTVDGQLVTTCTTTPRR